MRIRTIKPEFFKHDGIAALPPLTRILFIGLWSLADKEGRLEDRARRIKIEVLPYEDCEIELMLCELCAGGFIHRYETKDRTLRVIQIHNFDRHQRITGKESDIESKFPEFNPDTCVDWMGKQRGNNGETPGKHPGSNGETTETTGREGKGKEGNSSSRPDSAAPTPDGDCPPASPKDPHPNPEAEVFVDWFLALLAETGAPVPKLTPSSRHGWADAFDKLLRLDGKTADQVHRVCRWARNDQFWRGNFMSPAKLREKRDGVSYCDFFLNKMGTAASGIRKPYVPAGLLPES